MLFENQLTVIDDLDFNDLKTLRSFIANDLQLFTEAFTHAVSMLDTVNVYLIDDNFKVLFWPKLLERIYGHTKDFINNKNIFDILKTEPKESITEIHQTMPCKGEWRGELRHKSQTNDTVCVTSHWTKIQSTVSNSHLYIVDESDISDLKRLEDIRNLSFSMMKHDIKSPLSGILNATTLMLSEKCKTCHGPEKEYLELVHDSSRRTLAQVERHFLYLNLENGSYTPNIIYNNIHDTLTGVVDGLKAFHSPKKITTNLIMKPGPDSSCDSLLFPFDTALLEIAASNLVKNAYEAAPLESTVEIECAVCEDCLTCRIENEGAVPESIRNRFFEKYISAGKNFGTGLGTYIAKRAVEAHGGEISMLVLNDKKTRITFTLPTPPRNSECSP